MGPLGVSRDVAYDHPSNLVFGIARDGLMDGRLLLAADAIYKHHSNADTLRAIYDNQWCFQFGSQYAVDQRIRLRSGYVFAENPMRAAQLQSIGGVDLPDGIPAVRYVQGQSASITQHRVTCGIGIRDFQPNMDVDLFAGYAFASEDQFANTTVNIDGNYWVGFGTTWRFGGRCDTQCETAGSAY